MIKGNLSLLVITFTILHTGTATNNPAPPQNLVVDYRYFSDVDPHSGLWSPSSGSWIVPTSQTYYWYTLPNSTINNCEWRDVSIRTLPPSAYSDPTAWYWDLSYAQNTGFDPTTGEWDPRYAQLIAGGLSMRWQWTLTPGWGEDWHETDGKYWVTLSARYRDDVYGDYILLAANQVWIGYAPPPPGFSPVVSQAYMMRVNRWVSFAWMSSLVMCSAYFGVGM